MGRVAVKVRSSPVPGAAKGDPQALRFAEEGADIIVVDILRDQERTPSSWRHDGDMDETVELVEKTGQRMGLVG